MKTILLLVLLFLWLCLTPYDSISAFIAFAMLVGTLFFAVLEVFQVFVEGTSKNTKAKTKLTLWRLHKARRSKK